METPKFNPDQEFATLLEANHAALYRNAFGALRDQAEAEDVLQDVALEFLNNLRAGKIHTNPRACLFGLLKLRVTDQLRRGGRRRHHERSLEGPCHDDKTVSLGQLLPALDDVEGQGLASVAGAELAARLRGLTPEQRLLVAWHDAGLSDAEIATMLGITVAAAKKRRQRALQVARKLLDARQPPDQEEGV